MRAARFVTMDPSMAWSALWLTADGVRTEPRPGAVQLRGVEPLGDEGTCAVALVAPGCTSLRVNGMRVESGLWLLCHADRVELGATTVWVALELAPEHVAYEPALHGTDLGCCRLKVKLRPGEPIVICCGTASHTCGMVFRAAAWGAVCPNCGFDPAAERWTPPALQPRRRRLDAFGLARGR